MTEEATCVKCKCKIPAAIPVESGVHVLCHCCYVGSMKKQLREELLKKLKEMAESYEMTFKHKPGYIAVGPGIYTRLYEQRELDPASWHGKVYDIMGVPITINYLLADHAILLRQTDCDATFWASVEANITNKELHRIEHHNESVEDKIKEIHERISKKFVQNDDRNKDNYERRHDRAEHAIDELVNVVAEDHVKLVKTMQILTKYLEKQHVAEAEERQPVSDALKGMCSCVKCGRPIDEEDDPNDKRDPLCNTCFADMLAGAKPV